MTTVVTPSKCTGRAAPHRPSVSPATCTVVRGGPCGYISSTGRHEQHVDALGLARPRRRRRDRAGTRRGPRSARTAVGFTKSVTTTRSVSARAARMSERWPSWKKPIVGTSPTVCAGAPGLLAALAQLRDRLDDDHRSTAVQLGVVAGRTSCVRASRERAVRVALAVGERVEVAADGLDVAAGDRTGERARPDRASATLSSVARTSGRNASSGTGATPLDLVEQRDEMVRRRCTRPRGSGRGRRRRPRPGCSPSAARASRTCGSPATAHHAPASRAGPASVDGQRLQRVQRAGRAPGPRASASSPRAPGEVDHERVGRDRGASRGRHRVDRGVRASRRSRDRRPGADVLDRRPRRAEARAPRHGCSARRGCGRRPRRPASPRPTSAARSSCRPGPGPRAPAHPPVPTPFTGLTLRRGSGPSGPDLALRETQLLAAVTVTPSQPSAGCVDALRRDVVQRREHEGPLLHPGVRDLEVGLVDARRRRTSRTSTSSVRGPQRTVRTRSLELLDACAAARAARAASRSVSTATTAFRKSSCVGPADRRGLVDRRHRDDVDRRRSRRVRRPRAAGARAGRRGSNRGRGTAARSHRDADGHVVEHRPHRRVQLAHRHGDRAAPGRRSGTPRRSGSRAARAAGSARS